MSSKKVSALLVVVLLALAGCLGQDLDGDDFIDYEEWDGSPRSTELELEYVVSALPEKVYDVAVVGNYAYLAASMGMLVIKVSDPDNPVRVNHLSLSSSPHRIKVYDNYMFLLSKSELWTFNISNPVQPTLVSFLSIGGYDFEVKGDYIYLAQYKGLVIIDISDPTNPVDTGSFLPSSNTYSIGVSEGYVYLGSIGINDLIIINVFDPTNPAITEKKELVFELMNRLVDIEVVGDYAFGAGFLGGLHIFDVSDPSEFNKITSFGTGYKRPYFAISGDYLYLIQSRGLEVVDISNVGDPTALGNYFIEFSDDSRIAVNGNYAFVANENSGLHIFNVSDPYRPEPLGIYELLGKPHDVVVIGDIAYLASGSGGLHTFDISDKKTPTLLGSLDTPGNAQELEVTNDLVFLADGNGGLRIINVTDPRNLSEIGNITTPDAVQDVVIALDYAYLAATESGLRIIDISNPKYPKETGYYDTPGYATAIAIKGDYVYIADLDGGLRIIDVSTPAAPVEATTYDLTKATSIGITGEAHGVVIRGEELYVSLNYGGVQIINISDPRTPKLSGGFFRPPEFTTYITFSGNYILTTHKTRLEMFTLNRTETANFKFYSQTLSSSKVTMIDDYIYLISSSFIILRLIPPPTATIDVDLPLSVKAGESIIFNGSGTDFQRNISAYEWRSNIDGVLSNKSYFTTNNLSAGNHTIYFQVKNEKGVWSHPAIRKLTVVTNTEMKE